VPESLQKVHKILAGAGLGSRREIETWIAAGRVAVNGEPAHIGQRVSVKDRIEVDGRRIQAGVKPAPEILLLNKAPGVVCTRRDPEGRPTIFADLPDLRQGRWVSVGRLDLQSAGLLLLTNDGELANRLMHPSTGLDREYAVRIDTRLPETALRQLCDGVEVDGERMRFSDIRYYNGSGRNFWYHVVLLEGKNREVRRLFEAVGCTVSRLKRVRYGPVILPSWLRSGQWTSLQTDDVKTLYRLLKLPYAGRRARAGKQSKVARSSCLLPYPELS